MSSCDFVHLHGLRITVISDGHANIWEEAKLLPLVTHPTLQARLDQMSSYFSTLPVTVLTQ